MHLVLRNLTKRYGEMVAVSNFSIDVQKGEFYGLLGQSGCGKTTALRMIAGLILPDEGSIEFNKQDITRVPSEQRGFGMVFQNYALFPHMNIFENVAFGLRARHLSKDEIVGRVREALSLVNLGGYEQRRVDELSGGQQQRVAIARAIAIQPLLLLFDEPLSNLDAALREKTRQELRELITRLGLTALYVTHDQEEAFALCDRISVMDAGALLQTGTPRELYEQPNQITVASFIGRNNLVKAKSLKQEDGGYVVQTLTGNHRLKVAATEIYDGIDDDSFTLAIRPEKLRVTAQESSAENTLAAQIKEINYAGATTRLKLDAAGLDLEALVIGLDGLAAGGACFVELPRHSITVLKK
jgi:ABC-type Fe3+/spermidine/putrescine transport system ATPase subunit